MFKAISALILSLSLSFSLVSFAEDGIVCTKESHTQLTKIEVTSVQTEYVKENIVVHLGLRHFMCINENGIYSWQVRNPMTDYQGATYPDGTFRMHYKRGEAYLGNPDFTTFQVLNLENLAEQTLTFTLPVAGAVLPHHKLHFFEKTYGRVDFSDGENLDPAIDTSLKKVIDISK